MNQNIAILRSAALAGLCISIGCVVNLRVGGVAGAALFAFGLLAVVHYKLKLYTGTAGFIRAKGDWTMLTLVLVGNIIACGLTAWAISYAQPDVLPADHVIVQSRLAKGPLACFLLAIGCGFTHSIADAFYFLIAPELYSTQLLIIYLAEVLGNFVGCNLYRWTISTT